MRATSISKEEQEAHDKEIQILQNNIHLNPMHNLHAEIQASLAPTKDNIDTTDPKIFMHDDSSTMIKQRSLLK